jgi:GTP-binding protein
MFIDEAKISVLSGKGGDGVVHFRREKYVPRGGPDGGDGGKGGDVALVVSPHLNTLYAFQRTKRFQAPNGSKGGGNNKTGRSGENLEIRVPPGTVVYNDDSGEVAGDLVGSGCSSARVGEGERETPASPPRAIKPRGWQKKASRGRRATCAWN